MQGNFIDDSHRNSTSRTYKGLTNLPFNACRYSFSFSTLPSNPFVSPRVGAAQRTSTYADQRRDNVPHCKRLRHQKLTVEIVAGPSIAANMLSSPAFFCLAATAACSADPAVTVLFTLPWLLIRTGGKQTLEFDDRAWARCAIREHPSYRCVLLRRSRSFQAARHI